MTRDAGVPLTDGLTRLAVLVPDRARAERTRRRCQAMLERQRRQLAPGPAPAPAAASRLRPAMFGAFCLVFVAYVTELVATAVRLLSR